MDDVLYHSEARFGPAVADRYRLLIAAALQALCADPERLGVRSEADLAPDLRPPRTADRYRRLILAGFDSLREDPDRAGVRHDPELDPNLRLYALRHCRTRVEPRERIAHPRHVLAFLAEADRVIILRVLDERSDMAERLRETR